LTNETAGCLSQPGSTSTKFGVYARDGAELVRTIRHGQDELAGFRGQPMLAQLDYRAELIEQALAAAGYAADGFAAVAAGRLLPQRPVAHFGGRCDGG